MDLHIDIMSTPMKYHKSVAFDTKIAEELDRICEAIGTAELRVRGGDAVVTCPVCSKEVAGRFLKNHIKVYHPSKRARKR